MKLFCPNWINGNQQCKVSLEAHKRVLLLRTHTLFCISLYIDEMVKCKEAFASQNSIGLALLPRGNFTKSLSIATFLLGLVSTSILPLLPFPPTWHGNCSTKESSSQKSFFLFSRFYTKTKWLINKATWPDVGTKRSFLFRFLCDDGKSLEARDSLSEKFATTVL